MCAVCQDPPPQCEVIDISQPYILHRFSELSRLKQITQLLIVVKPLMELSKQKDA